jgi:hypothetical protein
MWEMDREPDFSALGAPDWFEVIIGARDGGVKK